ncbi:hypothetical protein K435DRAFT_221469 [Dendrothele bispora CBS 962.96]|uniref:Uncharacterized protein n=1 Tax=Dendrothele bispora (strain CBS 962.96) TaxID=1314807 RepID=A0A4S8LQY3_DENBC|nr:hypothetical protein K435DRAFT_221469 [Dendrothele bispora CBS 962.96]
MSDNVGVNGNIVGGTDVANAFMTVWVAFERVSWDTLPLTLTRAPNFIVHATVILSIVVVSQHCCLEMQEHKRGIKFVVVPVVLVLYQVLLYCN